MNPLSTPLYPLIYSSLPLSTPLYPSLPFPTPLYPPPAPLSRQASQAMVAKRMAVEARVAQMHEQQRQQVLEYTLE